MTELEKIERARMYMEKLANGINPLDDSIIPDGEAVNQVRLSRCFFYVADVLRQVIDNGGLTPPTREPRIKQVPFSLSHEKRLAFAPSQQPISVTELAKRISALSDVENMKNLTYKKIRDWLVEIGLLQEISETDGKTRIEPTAQGIELGVFQETRTGMYGNHTVTLYSAAAQQFVMDNLDAILAKIEPKPLGTQSSAEK